MRGDLHLEKFIILAVAVGALAACTFQKDKQPAGAGTVVSAQAQTGYPLVKLAVFQPKCVGCHSSDGRRDAGLALDSYKLVQAALARVRTRALEQRDMPPGGLPESEQATLRAWIESGAPEMSMKARNRKLEGSPNWNLVRENILGACLECHSQPEPIAGIDLAEYDVFRKNKEAIMNRVILSSDHPPRPFPALSEDDKLALLRWILRGLPR